MTCSKTRSLLDDYVDRELPTAEAAEVQAHLEGCDGCRQEHERLVRLKELLAVQSVPEPPDRYWEEVTSLIKARTIDRQERRRPGVNRENRQDERVSFFRSVMSVAASLVLLGAALWFSPDGNGRPTRQYWTQGEPSTTTQPKNPVSQPLAGLSQAQQDRIAGGIVLLGSPGGFGSPASIAFLFDSGGRR